MKDFQLAIKIQLYVVGVCMSLFLVACTSSRKIHSANTAYTLAFGSCTDAQKKEQQLWKEIEAEKPNLFLILGDIVYAKTDSLRSLTQQYQLQKAHLDYQHLLTQTIVDGIYDDNDYGQNDGGKTNKIKTEVKELVLNFFDIPNGDDRRNHEGLYFTKSLTPQVRLIVLDNRTFRDDLTVSTVKGKRYEPNVYGVGSMLGETQWQWLNNQIQNSKEDKIVLASTIQIVNNFHSYESWGNMPHERDKLFALIQKYPNKHFVLLSGDRHFSEISQLELPGLPYPLIDITSSGITQIYTGTQAENNPLRVSPFIREYNFTVLRFEEDKLQVSFVGKNNQVFYKTAIRF
jgi:alkaline phosphatase D